MFFGEEDHRARIRALQEQLAAQGLDAVVLTDEANIAYFAGYHPEHCFLTRSRMLALVVPATGAPIAVAPSSHARDVAEQTGLTHVIGYDDLRHAPVEDIGAALDELGAERVGMELGFEQRVNMTARDLEGLRRRVRAQIMDVTDAIWALRTVKSAAELALIERACRIGEQALDRCVP